MNILGYDCSQTADESFFTKSRVVKLAYLLLLFLLIGTALFIIVAVPSARYYAIIGLILVFTARFQLWQYTPCDKQRVEKVVRSRLTTIESRYALQCTLEFLSNHQPSTAVLNNGDGQELHAAAGELSLMGAEMTKLSQWLRKDTGHSEPIHPQDVREDSSTSSELSESEGAPGAWRDPVAEGKELLHDVDVLLVTTALSLLASGRVDIDPPSAATPILRRAMVHLMALLNRRRIVILELLQATRVTSRQVRGTSQDRLSPSRRARASTSPRSYEHTELAMERKHRPASRQGAVESPGAARFNDVARRSSTGHQNVVQVEVPNTSFGRRRRYRNTVSPIEASRTPPTTDRDEPLSGRPTKPSPRADYAGRNDGWTRAGVEAKISCASDDDVFNGIPNRGSQKPSQQVARLRVRDASGVVDDHDTQYSNLPKPEPQQQTQIYWQNSSG